MMENEPPNPAMPRAVAILSIRAALQEDLLPLASKLLERYGGDVEAASLDLLGGMQRTSWAENSNLAMAALAVLLVEQARQMREGS